MCRRPPSSERERVELALRRGQAVEDRVGVADQQLAGLRQADAAGGALDQPRAGLGLERGDLAGDGGLGERERLGRGGEGAVRGDLAQDPEASDVEHDQSVYQSGGKIICVYTSPESRMLAMQPHPALSQALIDRVRRRADARGARPPAAVPPAGRDADARQFRPAGPWSRRRGGRTLSRVPERLTPLDASFLHTETASAHMHVAWKGRFRPDPARPPITLARVRAQVASRLGSAPRFRMRLAFPPGGFAAPVWVDAEGFDLRRHVMALSDG